MAENVCPNAYSGMEMKRKPRFSLPANDRSLRREKASIPSLLLRSPNCSGTNSPCNSSSDGEWARFQAELNSTNGGIETLESDSDCSFEDNDGVARVLNFDSPDKRRRSIGTLNNQKKEIELMKRDMELDDEINELMAQKEEMEETFRMMFAEVTQQRLVCELKEQGKDPDVSQVYQLVNSLDLRDVDHVEWATRIEKAIESFLE